MSGVWQNALNRDQEGNEKMDRMDIIQAICEIYTSAYYIDLKKNSFVELSSMADVQKHIGKTGNAQEQLQYFSRHMVTPEFTDEMYRFVDLSTLDERLANTRIISKEYCSALFSTPEVNGWSQCSFIEGDRDTEGKLQHVIFVTQSIQNAKIKELEAQEALKKANEELTELLDAEKKNTAIIGSLSSIFFALYFINLEDNSFQEIISLDNLHHVYGEKGNARNMLKHLVDTLVAEESRSLMRIFTDIDTIDTRLGNERIIVQEFVARLGGWTRCSIIPVEKGADGKNKKIICGFRQITAEKEKLETQNTLIMALSMSYENVYSINADTGVAVCYRMGQAMSDRYGQKFAIGNYESNLCAYIENDVYEEDKSLFEKIRTIDGVNKVLEENQTYYFTYRVFRNNYPEYYQCQIVKPSSKRNEFVVGFKNVDEEKKRELVQREIIEGLGSEYYSVLLVDPYHDTVTTYRAEDEDGRAIAAHFLKHNYCWSKGLESYAMEQVSEDSRDNFMEKLSLAYMRKDGQDYSLTYEKITDDGSMYLQARVAFVQESQGNFVVVVGTRNVDDLIKKERQQEMALKEAFDMAEAANRAKTDFLSNMSHDIRTPMNGIIGMTAIAAAHIDDKDRVQDCLQKITQASKHLLSLINEVLDMSKIESGKVQLMEEEFNLSDLVENLISMTSSQIEEHHHEFSVNISGVIHEAVIGDSLRIQKVFTNLMGNAVKFTPDGGKISLTISERPCTQSKVGCYEFVFEDNGIGIQEEFLEQIFEPFARAEDSKVYNIQGTGLGMPISRNIVRMMGGDIKVESKHGEGSKFIVTMYLKLQDMVEVQYDKFVDLDVLVVDDDSMSMESCCSILNDLGMRAEGVTSGSAAVEKVVAHHMQEQDYFACIIDWKMPDMDGIATTRAIRKTVGDEVPIIIISAYDWSDIEQEARAAGANAFISKPLFRSRLEKTFNTLVGEEKQHELYGPFRELEKIDLTGRRALLAEDNELNAEIAVEILQMTGLHIDRVVDGMEAVDRITACEDGYYDIIFMDIQMPRMNGYDAVRAIRAMDRNYCKQIPIVAMTANAFAEDVLAAKTVGMNEHIAKPFEIKTLAKTLKKWI